MAIIPSSKYPGQIDTSDPNGYPNGKAQNVTTAGDGSGTPLEKDWLNDFYGFVQAMLGIADLTASGNPEAVGIAENLSQIVEALDVRLGSAGRLRHFPDLGNAFDLDVQSDVGQDNIRGPYVEPRGRYFWVCNGAVVYRYSFPDGRFRLDGSTLTPDHSETISEVNVTAESVWFRPDTGTKMWVSDDQDNVFQYTLSTPWDVTTATYDSLSLGLGTENDSVRGIFIADGGTKLYAASDGVGNEINRYDLPTPWTLSGAGFATGQVLDTTANVLSPQYVHLTDDGKILLTGNGTTVNTYDLSTAWDLTTATHNATTYTITGSSHACATFGLGYLLSTNTGGSGQVKMDVIGRTVMG